MDKLKICFKAEKRRDRCDTAAKAGTIVFDYDDGEANWATKLDWTYDQLYSFKDSSEYSSPYVTSVCSTNDLFSFVSLSV